MKYQKVALLSLSWVLMVAVAASAQTPAGQTSSKRKRPMKNQPQFPYIIDTEEKATPPDKAAPAAISATPQQSELLVRAVESLAGEVRSLVQEMRALNLRQQAQLDMLRLTRADSRLDLLERELKATRDRITQLEADEQNLQLLMKPESLEAQTRSVGTLDRSETMRQVKAAHEARLRGVVAEKEMLQKREAELVTILEGYRTSSTEAEARIQKAEEMIRQLTAPPPVEPKKEPPPETAKPAPPAERKP